MTLTSSPPISGTFTSTTALAVGAAATSATACGAGAEPAVSNTNIGEPVVTLSPTFTKTSFTTPASGAGTSIEALSPSTLIIDWSTAMVSPTLTITSVTVTSSPPISGT